MTAHLLLVEDDPGLRRTIADLFMAEGYQVTPAPDGPTGLSLAQDNSFDLLLLDWMMPGKNGIEVCRELRQSGNDVPILMLTAKTQVVDRVVGLKMGADDYLAKPFDPAELVARVEALLRRSAKSPKMPLTSLSFGGVAVDFRSGRVTKAGGVVNLTTKEIHLLRYLAEHRDQVVSRDELLANVWSYQGDITSRTIDVHIAWLRQKLEDDPPRPRHIHTVRGAGYRFTL